MMAEGSVGGALKDAWHVSHWVMAFSMLGMAMAMTATGGLSAVATNYLGMYVNGLPGLVGGDVAMMGMDHAAGAAAAPAEYSDAARQILGME